MSVPAIVLVIEDEPNTRILLRDTLDREGYHCAHAANGAAGVRAVIDYDPSVVVLDLGLPDMAGMEVIERIRERSTAVIIVLSARSDEPVKVAALDGGANDYVTKPFFTEELLARIRVWLRARRSMPSDPGAARTTTIGQVTIDHVLRRVTLRGNEVHLTPIEYRLLVVMARSGGRVLSHQEILRQVWGARAAEQVNYLRVYMKKLRYKLEEEPAKPKHLVSEPGVGYRLRVDG